MTFQTLSARIPSYAKDLKLNLSSLLAEDKLSEQQKYGAILASALASGNRDVIDAASEEAGARLSAAAIEAAKSAAAVMAMNNVYYRFTHLASNKSYETLPARLRMNVIGNPGVEKEDFELWSLAVSAINGCGRCVDAHEGVLREAGVSVEAIQAAVRIAAVVNAIGAVFESEASAPSAQHAAA